MGKTSLGIYDLEGEYAKRLGRYIRRKAGELLEVRIFTKTETLKHCLEKRELALALVSADAMELCLSYDDVWTAVLAEELHGPGDVYEVSSPNHGLLRESPLPAAGERCPFIARYQSAEAIWQELLALAGDRIFSAGVLPVSEKKTVMIAVASPINRIRKTAFTFAFGRILAEKKKGRVLILTLDEFSGSDPEEGGAEPQGGDLSELFYYYSQNQLTSGKICMALGHAGEADYIRPARFPEDFYKDGKPYPPAFFEQLAVLGGYRYLIIDVGNSFAFRGELLTACGNILIPGQGRREEEIGLAAFAEWLMRLGAEGKQIPVRTAGNLSQKELEKLAAGVIGQCRALF